MQPNYDIWGVPNDAASAAQGYVYVGFNQRGGTSNINDPDFTEFPPVAICNNGNYYGAILWNWFNDGKLSLENEIDKTICYVGMYNSELPQLNMIGLVKDTYNTIENPFYYTDNTQIQSFFYATITNYNEFADRLDWNYSKLYTNSYTAYNYRLRRYVGGLAGTAPYSPNYPANCNANGIINPFEVIGLKSFILEIMVRYKTGMGTYGPTSTMCSLKTYAEQTTEWKSEHPIIWAAARVWFRSNKNGTYSNGGAPGFFGQLVPCFTLPFKTDVAGYDDNTTYTLTMCRTTATASGYFPIYGALTPEKENSAWSTATGQTVAAVLMGANRGELNTLVTAGYRACWLELDGSDDDNLEYIRRGCAAYGMFFCDDIGTLAAAGGDVLRWIDDKMCLGIVDENGRTNGDYSHGIQNALQINFNWKDTTESVYDPSLPPVPQNEYSNTTTFNSIGDIVTLTQRYVLNGTAVSHLGRELWSITADMIDDGGGGEDFSELNDKILDTFLTNNPIDCIVSLQRFPLEIPKTANSVKIKLGKAETQVSAYQMEKTAYTYLFTGKPIAPKFGDSFLDYEPYTKMELYIPFCGTVQLNPADIIDRQLNVQLVVDFCTGTCTGFVMSDDLVIETVNGNIAIDIPVTGMQSATVASQLNNAIAAKTSAQKTIFNSQVGVITPAGFVKFALNPLSFKENIDQAKISEQRADYELRHQNAALHIIGSASPAGGWAIDLNCRLIIYYPSGEVIRTAKPPEWNDTALARYGRTTGFACCIENSIGSMSSGLVVGINPDLNGMVTESTAALPATAAEIDLIRAAIEEGVII